MKTFLVTMLMFIAFSSGLFAQFTVQNERGTDTRILNYTYAVDSAETITSNQFSLADFDGGLSITNPATFYFDHDSTGNGADATLPNVEIIVWGVYNGASYTFPLDTVIAAAANGQGLDDSLGVLDFNTWSAPVYYITIASAGGNVTAGILTITFPKREHPRVSEIDNTW